MIPIARPDLGDAEAAAVIAVLRSGELAQGRRVEEFEAAFAAATGARHAVAASNGSTALQLALMAHGIGAGCEVIVSPLTFIATANAIVHAGARPVFADVDGTLNLSPACVEAAITPRTRAILPVHLHGGPADLGGLTAVARRHGLLVVQDACQAIGATVDGLPLGAYGTAAYSLYATKNITTGEGGMLTTDDAGVARLARSLRSQGQGGKTYLHERIAYNFRMTELQAAIGLVQLGRLPAVTAARRANAAFYDRAIPTLRRPRRTPGACHVFHQYCLFAEPSLDRDDAIARLREAGVAAAVHYPVPVHLQPAYAAAAPAASCPNAEAACRRIFSIPVHPSLTAADREHVAAAVNALR